LASPGRQQFLTPLGEAVAHICDRAWLGAVLRERGVGDLAECPEGVSEEQPVESMVSVRGQFQKLLAGVPTAGYDCVYIEEVTW
jgi:hypothetical protein